MRVSSTLSWVLPVSRKRKWNDIYHLSCTYSHLPTVLTKWQAWDWECSWSLHNHCAVARHVDQYLRHILIHVVNMSIWFHYIVSAACTYKHEPRVKTKHQELTSQKQIRYEYKNGSWIDDLCFPGMVSKFQDRPIYLDGNLETSGRIGPYDRWEQKHRKKNGINRMIGSFHHPKERPTPIYKTNNRWVPIYYSMCHWHPLPTRQGTRTSQATFRGATKCRGRMRKMIRKRPGAGASPWNQNTKGRTGRSGRTQTK